jgi:adenosyl cobinamide kinase/adenosyl cobinamide phosphate guanylyltransferase
MGTVVRVTGGARSAKSLFAETLAAGLGACVTYVATAEVSDAEMDARIARHRERRPASWISREAPHDLRTGLAGLDQQVDVVLVDCLTVWAANRLLALGDPEQGGLVGGGRGARSHPRRRGRGSARAGPRRTLAPRARDQ